MHACEDVYLTFLVSLIVCPFSWASLHRQWYHLCLWPNRQWEDIYNSRFLFVCCTFFLPVKLLIHILSGVTLLLCSSSSLGPGLDDAVANAASSQALSRDLRGVMPRVCEHIFSQINNACAVRSSSSSSSSIQYACKASYLEIYNDRLYDLLNFTEAAAPAFGRFLSSSFSLSMFILQLTCCLAHFLSHFSLVLVLLLVLLLFPFLVHIHLLFFCVVAVLFGLGGSVSSALDEASGPQIREDLRRGVYVDNLMEQEVRSVADCMRLIEIGAGNRRTAATAMNRESSRSHAVFCLTITSKVCLFPRSRSSSCTDCWWCLGLTSHVSCPFLLWVSCSITLHCLLLGPILSVPFQRVVVIFPQIFSVFLYCLFWFFVLLVGGARGDHEQSCCALSFGWLGRKRTTTRHGNHGVWGILRFVLIPLLLRPIFSLSLSPSCLLILLAIFSLLCDDDLDYLPQTATGPDELR